MFALATSFSVSQLIVLSSFAVDVSAVSCLCNDAQKMLKAFSVFLEGSNYRESTTVLFFLCVESRLSALQEIIQS